jgi:glucosylceramidase
MQHGTRRDFLRKAGLSGAAVVLASRKSLATVTGPGNAHVWCTSQEGNHLAAAEPPTWESIYPGVVADVIVFPEQRFQPILGFGAALTDASCFLISQMPEAERARFLHETYAPTGMNLSVARCCIGSSDYSTSEYSFDESPGDISLAHFSIGHDTSYILPTLRAVRAVRPDLFLHASPWSPPGWMKVFGSMNGGYIDRTYFAAYAEYFLKFLAAYKEAGVAVQAICSQNEVEAEQKGMMPACFWPPQTEADFVRHHLGPKIRASAEFQKTMIWLLDHNYILWKRVDWQLQDSRMAKYVDGVAWHGYEGQPEQMMELQRRHPALPMYFTEWSSFLGEDPRTACASWGHDLAEILSNGVRNITLWNLILDEKGKPDLGPFNCAGVVTLNSKSGVIEKSGQYWALYHYSAHLQRDAHRIASEAGDTNFTQIAFRNPNGECVLVLTNRSTPRRVLVQMGDSILNVPLPGDSVSTVTWQS